MRYDLTNPFHVEQARTRLEALIRKGSTVELTEKMVRSHNQNAYLHACLGWFGLRVGHTIQYVKEHYYKRLLSPDIFVRTTYDDILRRGVEYLRSSASLNPEEMTITIERFRNWAAENGEYIPSPEEHAFIRYIETEVERNKVFLARPE